MAGYRPGEACFVCKEKGHGAKFCPAKQQRLLQAQARKVTCAACGPLTARDTPFSPRLPYPCMAQFLTLWPF